MKRAERKELPASPLAQHMEHVTSGDGFRREKELSSSLIGFLMYYQVLGPLQ